MNQKLVDLGIGNEIVEKLHFLDLQISNDILYFI